MMAERFEKEIAVGAPFVVDDAGRNRLWSLYMRRADNRQPSLSGKARSHE